jgi:anti-sigma factor RsiW
MSCARVSREVIEFFRFGDLDARSAPHLEHLAVCADCREEVGLDRELVIQLQRALAARVDGHAASPGAWLEIRRRALQPEAPTWRGRFLPVLRLAPVGAIVIVLIAFLASSDLAPFRVAPSLPTTEPTWRNFQADASNDGADPFGGRWWLGYTSASAPSGPATGVLPTVDPGEALVALAERVGGPVR